VQVEADSAPILKSPLSIATPRNAPKSFRCCAKPPDLIRDVVRQEIQSTESDSCD